MEAVEGNQLHVEIPPRVVGAEGAGLARNRKNPSGEIPRIGHEDRGLRPQRRVGPLVLFGPPHVFRTEVAGQDEGAPEDRRPLRVVRKGLQMELLGQVDLDPIPPFPEPTDPDIGARRTGIPLLHAVHLQGEALSRPGGATEGDSQLLRPSLGDREEGFVPFREIRLHLEAEVACPPNPLGGGVEVHPEGLFRGVVDPVTVEGMALHPGADTAGEALLHVLVLPGDASPHRDHVAGLPVFGIHGAEDMVEEGPLQEVGVLDPRLQGEEEACHLEHVVDIAGFRGPPLGHLVQPVRCPEVLVTTVAAGGKAVVEGHPVPEEPCRPHLPLVAGVEVADQ
ncbi:MAG: hypothetical protein BWY86_01087 [Candidatus Aminicenantes bacterium ADurb.Bin508]|nr:MAG: hypothetical protein BWY86_01087 [Candidatus Aminicenantes bacterium ADurb.Bin508]